MTLVVDVESDFVVDSGGGPWRWAMGPNCWWILVVDFGGGLWRWALVVGFGGGLLWLALDPYFWLAFLVGFGGGHWCWTWVADLVGGRWWWAFLVDFADGWFPRGNKLPDPSAGIKQLKIYADQFGRDMNSLSVTVFRAPSDEAYLEKCRAAGIARVLLPLPSKGSDTVLPLLDQYAKLLSK